MFTLHDLKLNALNPNTGVVIYSTKTEPTDWACNTMTFTRVPAILRVRNKTVTSDRTGSSWNKIILCRRCRSIIRGVGN